MANLETSITIKLLDRATVGIKRVANTLKDISRGQKSLAGTTNLVNKSLKGETKALKQDIELNKKYNRVKKEQGDIVKDLGASLVGLGAGLEIKSKLTEIMQVGKDFQSMRFKLSAVLGVDMANKDLDSYITKFKSLAASGLGSYDEVANTGYSLFSAGLDKKQAVQGTAVALKVAKITGGEVQEVANMMATASKDFGDSMTRVGDVFTKAQIKFQIKDFQQLEEGLKYVAATAASVKMPIEQATTVIGALNNAGKSGSMAGTGFNQIINQMSKVDKTLKITVPRMKNGSLDFIKWTQMVADKIKKTAGGNLDKEHALANRLFGIEGGSAFAVMMNKLGELPGYLDDIKNHSKGIVNTNIAKYYQTFAAKTQALSSATSILYNAIAQSIIPILTNVVSLATQVIKSFTNLITNHKNLGKAIFITAGALAIFMTVAGGYKLIIKPMLGLLSPLASVFKLLRLNVILSTVAMRAFKVVVMATKIALWPLKLVLKGMKLAFIALGNTALGTRVKLIAFRVTVIALKTGLAIARVAMIAFNTVMLANPLGIVIAAIAALGVAVYELWKHWDKVKVFFKKLWGWLKAAVKANIEAILHPIKTLEKTWNKFKGWFGGGTKVKKLKIKQEVDLHKTIAHKVKTRDSKQQISNSIKKVEHHNKQQVTYNNTFNIQGNNLNHHEIADHVVKTLQKQHKVVMAG